jgi:predicted HicB family RNase H-like nuclease
MSIPRYGYRVAWSDEDQAYVATCAELDGLSGLGDTAEEALSELRVAVELAIEEFVDTGAAIPEPLQATSHSGQFRLRLPKSVHARLVERAESEAVSLNALVASYVAVGLGDAEACDNARRAVVDAVGQLHSVFTLQLLTQSGVPSTANASRVISNVDVALMYNSGGGTELWQS